MTDAMDSLEEIVPRVAEYTVGMEMEGTDWQKALAVDGLLAVDEQLEAARRLVDRAVATQTSAGQFDYGYGDYPKEWVRWTDYDMETYKPTANPASMAASVLEFYDRTGEEGYLDAVRRQYEFFDTVDRTADGGISRRADEVELFTEIIHFLCPFFTRYGRITGDSEPVEEAVRQIEVHVKHLQDPHTGLFRHVWKETPNSYPGGRFWSRGNGWGAAGLLNTLDFLPEDHPGRETVVEALVHNAEAVVDLQDRSGFLYQLLDDPTSPLETSGTAIYAYTFRRGIDEGYLDEDRFGEAARRAMEACLGVVSEDGAVERVSKPPASSFAPLGVTPYGQGWFLLAASRFL